MAYATRTRISECLVRSQANSLASYLNYKRYHWYTFGPLFRDLHLFFDELSNVAIEEVDPTGERLRMLGGEPISTPDEIRRHASIHISEGTISTQDMLREALDNEKRIVSEMRDAVRIAEEENDPGSVDLYSGMVRTHEKYVWFISEMLRRGDGLVS
jgi:starvation-inducible DNA-binding protein